MVSELYLPPHAAATEPLRLLSVGSPYGFRHTVQHPTGVHMAEALKCGIIMVTVPATTKQNIAVSL